MSIPLIGVLGVLQGRKALWLRGKLAVPLGYCRGAEGYCIRHCHWLVSSVAELLLPRVVPPARVTKRDADSVILAITLFGFDTQLSKLLSKVLCP